MRIGIIGAGFGGLTAGYKLAKKGNNVVIFESENYPGGLASGYKEPDWNWFFEKYYHHWFTSDFNIKNLAEELGEPITYKKVKTSTYIDGKVFQIDSPKGLLLFNKLPILDRIRTGLILAYLRITPYWKNIESITSKSFISKYMGKRSWDILWEPLFYKKFNNYEDKINAAWFWARIKKRSNYLGYPKGGFLKFALSLDRIIRKYGGEVMYKTPIKKIEKKNYKFLIYTDKNIYEFNKVIATVPSQIFVKIVNGLPNDYIKKLLDLETLGTINLVLSLNSQFLTDGTYWMNINAKHFPFLAIIEHTNFIDKRNYNNEHLLYIGNYLPNNHPYFRKDALDLLKEFYPFLKTINPRFDKSWINKINVFKSPYTQPIMTVNYSKKIPDFETPIEGLYLSNMQQVYPWDRGTNYAIENGELVADKVLGLR